MNGSRWVPIPSEPPHSPRGSGTSGHAGREPPEQEEKPEANGTLPPSIFGPKKKFRPVVQRPAPKDTSLHSALMEAIHSAGGKDRLRKVNGQAPACRAQAPVSYLSLPTSILRWHRRRRGGAS